MHSMNSYLSIPAAHSAGSEGGLFPTLHSRFEPRQLAIPSQNAVTDYTPVFARNQIWHIDYPPGLLDVMSMSIVYPLFPCSSAVGLFRCTSFPHKYCTLHPRNAEQITCQCPGITPVPIPSEREARPTNNVSRSLTYSRQISKCVLFVSRHSSGSECPVYNAV